mgnify:FL=1
MYLHLIMYTVLWYTKLNSNKMDGGRCPEIIQLHMISLAEKERYWHTCDVRYYRNRLR